MHRKIHLGFVRWVSQKIWGQGDRFPQLRFEKSLSHYLVSLFAIYDMDKMLSINSTWWTYSATQKIYDFLEKDGASKTVFEWGAGASTLILADKSESVVSVEYDNDFYHHMLGLPMPESVSLIHEPGMPSENPKIKSSKKGHEHLDFYGYVNSRNKFDAKFDLIVIDGRAREECLPLALEKLAEDGLIVFDDMFRARYAKAVNSWAKRGGLRIEKHSGLAPALPYPSSTWIISKK